MHCGYPYIFAFVNTPLPQTCLSFYWIPFKLAQKLGSKACDWSSNFQFDIPKRYEDIEKIEPPHVPESESI